MSETYGNPLEDLSKSQENSVLNPLTAHIVNRFNSWETARKAMEQKWLEYYRIYRCISDPVDAVRASEKSQIKIPATKEAVNNASDSLYQILFSSRPFFRIKPRLLDVADPAFAEIIFQQKQKSADKISKFLRYIFEQNNDETLIYQAIVEMCVYGTIIAQVVASPFMNSALKKIRNISPAGEAIETIVKYEQKTIRPKLEFVPLENFYIDPKARDIASAEGMIKRSWVKRYELNRLKYLGVIDRLPEETFLAENSAADDTHREIKQSYHGLYSSNASTDEVELFEYWGWIDKDILNAVGFEISDKSASGAEMCVIIADRKYLLAVKENPYHSKERPFIRACYEYIPGEFYGSGIVEIAYGPQKALDATVRSRIDNKALAINQIFAINADKFVPGQNLSLYPGKVFLFHGNPHESLMPFVIPDVTSGTYQEAVEYERYIQSATSVSRLVGGMPSKKEAQTATEVSILMSQSNTRIRMLVKLFEQNFIIPLLKWYVRILFQYMSETELFVTYDEQSKETIFEGISPVDISEDFDFEALGTVSINAANETAKRMQLLTLSANPVDAQFVNRGYLYRKIYEGLDLDDADIAILYRPSEQQISQAGLFSSSGGATNLAQGAPVNLAQASTPQAPQSSNEASLNQISNILNVPSLGVK